MVPAPLFFRGPYAICEVIIQNTTLFSTNMSQQDRTKNTPAEVQMIYL